MTGLDPAARLAQPPLTYRGLPVPYVVAWSTEADADIASADLILRTDVVSGLSRLCYRDERAADRDHHGVLWHRVAWSPGQGVPRFAEIHTLRQRTAMARALCQVCGRPAQVWMVSLGLWQEHVEEHGPGAPYTTHDPAVCRACAVSAARNCPHLSGVGFVFLVPRSWANTAVRGQVVDPESGAFSAPRTIALPGTIPPPDPAIQPLVLAKSLASTLFDVRVHQNLREVAGLGPRRDRPAPAARPARRAPRRRR